MEFIKLIEDYKCQPRLWFRYCAFDGCDLNLIACDRTAINHENDHETAFWDNIIIENNIHASEWMENENQF